MTRWLLEPSVVRKARKEHRCQHCHNAIRSGMSYVEYLGETPAFQSGSRYHLFPCGNAQGVAQGVVIVADDKPAGYYIEG